MLVVNGKNIMLSQGDDASITLTITKDGAPYEMETGDSISFKVKKVEQTDYLISKSFSEPIIVIEHNDTDTAPEGVYQYDLILHYADGTQTALINPSDFIIKEVL